MSIVGPVCLPLQLPFTPDWLDNMAIILHVGYAMAVRGYLILVLVGFIFYATCLNDGLAKALVTIGGSLYLIGPPIINYLAHLAGLPSIDPEAAQLAWLAHLGVTDLEIVGVILVLGEIVVSICILSGTILYLTPTSGDLKSKGQSLLTHSIIVLPVLAFFHLTPWI